MKNKSRYLKRIYKSIIKKSPTIASEICISLYELGELTDNIFLTSKFSLKQPVSFFMGNGYKYSRIKIKEKTVRQTVRRLIKQGIIEKRNGKFILKDFVSNWLKKIKKRNDILNKKWDGKYRVVIFDIPEKKKKIRNWLRNELYLMKYTQLQKSVLVSKYPLPEDIIREIKEMKIEKYVDYLLADKIFSKNN